MLDIGQNDIVIVLKKGGTLDSVRRHIPKVIANIRAAMQVLYLFVRNICVYMCVCCVIVSLNALMLWCYPIKDVYKVGGRNFWVHNTGPHGCLPSQRNASGCRADINTAAVEFNAQLQRLCDQLRSEMEGSTIVYVDVHSIKLDIITNYTSHGKH